MDTHRMPTDPPSNRDTVDVGGLLAIADSDFAERRMEAAKDAYQQVLAVRTHDIHARHRIALACVHINMIDEAARHISLALQDAPDQAELWEHAGLIAALQGEHHRAEAFYRRAISIAGSTATLHRNLADCLRLSGRLLEAKIQYRKAVEIEPRLHHAIRAIARISTELGDIDDAADFWSKTCAIDASNPNDGIELVAALSKARRTAQLVGAIEQITTRFSDNAEVLERLSFVLVKGDRFGEALSVAKQGLAVNPQRAALHHYAAVALNIRGRTTESLPHSREAARLMPDNPAMQYQLAQVQLVRGEFAEGWARLRAFYSLPDITLAVPGFPRWDGEPVTGQTFLIVGEQGCGDEIQFIRFAAWLSQRGAVVDVLVNRRIARIAASISSIRTVFTAMPPGPYDYWSYMLRMPEHMKLDLPMLPIVMPYLAPEPDTLDFWRKRIKAIAPAADGDRRKRIGVVWAGGPDSSLDRFRSISVQTMVPLFALPGTTWFSIQKGNHERDSEILAGTFDIHTLGPAIVDFADTLAILHTLDLLITVDTSVAHLAGAANLPVWVLVPGYSEWRWMQDRTDSPWYPSMRLFRQRELGNWPPVIEEVKTALCQMLKTATKSEAA